MLFGAGVGAWVGSMGSSEEAMAQATLLETVATRLKNGDVAIIALAQERSEAPLDQFFGRFKTLVARWDAWRIQQEVVDAEQVQADLHERVRAELRTRRSEERHEMFEEFRQSLRQKFEDLKAMSSEGQFLSMKTPYHPAENVLQMVRRSCFQAGIVPAFLTCRWPGP